MEIEDDLEIMGESSQIERTVMNLLSNAFKHAPEHSTINLSGKAVDGSAIITISDEGAGIAEAQQEHLFERFFRADDARCRKEGEGAGLGLAICKRIVDAHGGDIWVVSQPGEGAAFMIRIPLSGADPVLKKRLDNILIDPESADNL